MTLEKIREAMLAKNKAIKSAFTPYEKVKRLVNGKLRVISRSENRELNIKNAKSRSFVKKNYNAIKRLSG